MLNQDQLQSEYILRLSEIFLVRKLGIGNLCVGKLIVGKKFLSVKYYLNFKLNSANFFGSIVILQYRGRRKTVNKYNSYKLIWYKNMFFNQ